MKPLAITLLFSVVLIAPSALAAEPISKEHPGAVALSQENGGTWTYKSFPQLTRLYTSRNDARGSSNCDETCATAWPPLYATEQDAGKKVGHWTVIKRASGQPQWAYKGQPVYSRFHDLPADAHAVEVEGFRPLQP
jgi:predicted lipoprotein with Yx(FWY)xxD motif